MPTYEDPNELKVVLAPVVVTTPTDTVPGLGLAGGNQPRLPQRDDMRAAAVDVLSP